MKTSVISARSTSKLKHTLNELHKAYVQHNNSAIEFVFNYSNLPCSSSAVNNLVYSVLFIYYVLKVISSFNHSKASNDFNVVRDIDVETNYRDG